jgi:NAD(P)-dependent dehydrogenase (short-subunit alcohol dehydrogenase family)
MDNNRPWAVITGACGDIGQALVRTFVSNGYQVIATDMHEPVKDLPFTHFIQTDLQDTVTDEAYASGIYQRIRNYLPDNKLNALINNAATQILGSVDELTREHWLSTLEVNLLAPFFMAQALLPELAANKGSVVNISSIHASLTKPGFVAYATSKAALSAMTRNMAVDIKGSVRVNAIEPAAVSTKMLRAGFASSPANLEDLENLHPVLRIATPEEVANVALFLCSRQASFMHGACVDVSGGIHSCLLDPVV